MFIAPSRALPERQMQDAKLSLGITKFVCLSDKLLEDYTTLIGEGTLEELQMLAYDIVVEAKAAEADYFLCQEDISVALHANLMANESNMACVASAQDSTSWTHIEFRGLF